MRFGFVAWTKCWRDENPAGGSFGRLTVSATLTRSLSLTGRREVRSLRPFDGLRDRGGSAGTVPRVSWTKCSSDGFAGGRLLEAAHVLGGPR
jgi:hypothetical protein